jgi:hypothetical protein
MNKRFEEVDKRFEQMMNFLWMLTGIFTTLTMGVIGFAYWDRRTILRKKSEKRDRRIMLDFTKGTAIVPNKAPTINISFISPPPSPSIPLRNLYALLIQKKNPDPRIAPAIELRVETPIIGAAKNANILPGMVRISGRIKILRSIKLKTIKIPPKIKNIKEVKEMPNFKTIRRDHTPEISSTMKYLMEILDLHFVHFPFNNM